MNRTCSSLAVACILTLAASSASAEPSGAIYSRANVSAAEFRSQVVRPERVTVDRFDRVAVSEARAARADAAAATARADARVSVERFATRAEAPQADARVVVVAAAADARSAAAAAARPALASSAASGPAASGGSGTGATGMTLANQWRDVAFCQPGTRECSAAEFWTKVDLIQRGLLQATPGELERMAKIVGAYLGKGVAPPVPAPQTPPKR